MMAHAIRSYYGSTQLLDMQGEPLWVVNEGEYRMMNTYWAWSDQMISGEAVGSKYYPRGVTSILWLDEKG